MEVELGRVPLLLEPAGADAELGSTPRDEVEGLDGPRRDEGVAEPDVVHVGPESHPFGAASEVGEVRDGVEDRRRRGHRRVLLAGVG